MIKLFLGVLIVSNLAYAEKPIKTYSDLEKNMKNFSETKLNSSQVPNAKVLEKTKFNLIEVDSEVNESNRSSIELKDNKVIVNIYISKNEKNDPVQAIEEFEFLKEKFIKEWRSPLFLLELLTNLKKDSADAQLTLKLLRANRRIDYSKLEEHKERFENENASLIQEVSKIKSLRMKQLKERRSESRALEMWEANSAKLNDMVLANDRAGVRKMLQDYLPWEMMEPFEKATWLNWLDAIEKPDLNNLRIGYRGLDYETDKVQRGKIGQVALLSSVLTRNQGSYTRRLRSLTTNRLINGEIKPNVYSDKSYGLYSTSVTEQQKRHAANPLASSFLSFTDNVKVTANFIDSLDGKTNGGLIAVAIDARRMNSNLSGISVETEMLVPLIVFPDEVIHYEEGHPDVEEFRKEVVKKVEKKFKPGSYNRLLMSSRYEDLGIKFYDDVIKRVNLERNREHSCKGLF